jgi:hypothetical protein
MFDTYDLLINDTQQWCMSTFLYLWMMFNLFYFWELYCQCSQTIDIQIILSADLFVFVLSLILTNCIYWQYQSCARRRIPCFLLTVATYKLCIPGEFSHTMMQSNCDLFIYIKSFRWSVIQFWQISPFSVTDLHVYSLGWGYSYVDQLRSSNQ